MIEPVDTRLDEAILAEPDAIEPRRVLADLLEERGHPRAELIRLAIEDEAKAKAFLAAHDEHAEALGVVHAIGLRCTWKLGFVDYVGFFGSTISSLADVWPTIATHRSYRFLRSLGIMRHDFRFDRALPPPASLRALHCEPDREVLASLAELELPRVEKLSISSMVGSRLDVGVLEPVFAASLPALVDLRFAMCLDEARVVELVALVVRSPLAKRLRRLSLDRFPDEAARLLVASGLSIELDTKHELLMPETAAALARRVQWKRLT